MQLRRVNLEELIVTVLIIQLLILKLNIDTYVKRIHYTSDITMSMSSTDHKMNTVLMTISDVTIIICTRISLRISELWCSTSHTHV